MDSGVVRYSRLVNGEGGIEYTSIESEVNVYMSQLCGVGEGVVVGNGGGKVIYSVFQVALEHGGSTVHNFDVEVDGL
eukprot:7576277-Heterocapsa_arctica.AAC.1